MIGKALSNARQLFSLSLGERAGVRADRKPPTRLLLLASLVLGHWSFTAAAADFQVTAYVTITNVPAGPPTNIVFNIGTSDTRTSTNGVVTPATSWQITNSTAATRTNLVNHLIANPVYSVGVGTPQLVVTLSQTNTSGIEFTAPVNTNLSVSFGGNWAKVYYVTNPFNLSNPILVSTNRMDAISRTNAANAIVNFLAATNVVPSNSIPPGAKSLQHYSDNTSAQTSSNKTFTAPVLNGGRLVNATNITGTNVALTNVTIHIASITAAQLSGIISLLTNGTAYNLNLVNATNRGIVGAITNGLWTNGTLLAPKFTNGVNGGNAFSSPYGVTGGEQFGSGATAAGINATALGKNSTASGVESSAFGYGASATASSATAGGNSATASAELATAYGYLATVSAANSGAFGASSTVSSNSSYSFGYGNTVTHSNTTAIGNGITSSGDNLVQIGSGTQRITLAGPVTDSTLTNTTLRGPTTVNSRLDYTSRANTALANGYNSGTILGTNVYIRLSGASGAATNAGFAAELDGSFHIVQIDNPGLSYTLLHDSGLEATAANRIYTGTGALVNSTNNPVMLQLLYDATASRYRLLSIR